MLDAVVIPFPKRAAPSAAHAEFNGPAQIIIFPGVRYMHIPEEPTDDIFTIATAPMKRPSKGKK